MGRAAGGSLEAKVFFSSLGGDALQYPSKKLVLH